MKKYESYTKSDLFWLQSIPSHWQIEKIGKLFSQVKCKNYGMAETNLLSLSYGTVKRRNINATEGLLPESFEGYNIIESGDIVLRLTDLQNDQKSLRTGLSTERGIITSAYITIRNRSNNLSEYLQMFLHVFDIAKGFYNVGASGVRQGLGWDDIKQLKIAIPPHEEQDQIVRFLDWKVSTINKLIGTKKKQIQAYEEIKRTTIASLVIKGTDDSVPMKDSGSKWLGAIPANWRCLRAKYLFREVDYRSLTGKEELLTVSHITGITPRSEKNVTMFKSESLIGYKICKTGQIAANTMWMWQGAIAVSNYDGVISPSYNTYEQINDEYIPEYLDFLLRAKPLVDNYVVLSSGIRKSRLRLYPEQFLTILFPVPPIEDQKRIIDVIRKRIAKIQDVISVRQQEISVLQEFKTRLISDVVTGKIDVRDIEVPAYEFVEEDGDGESEESVESVEGEVDEE